MVMAVGEPAAPAAIADGLDSLILRIRAGEKDAFELLMAQTEGRVLGLAWRLLGSRDQARDAAQEVFMRIYRSLDSFRLGESFPAWTARITVNVCADHARRRGPFSQATELEQLPHPASEDLVEAILTDQRRALLRQALAALTPAERSALVLRDLEGLSTEEAAAALGIRPVTVRSQISSARTKLRTFCERLLNRPKGGPP